MGSQTFRVAREAWYVARNQWFLPDSRARRSRAPVLFQILVLCRDEGKKPFLNFLAKSSCRSVIDGAHADLVLIVDQHLNWQKELDIDFPGYFVLAFDMEAPLADLDGTAAGVFH